MLRELAITNFALIDHTVIEFESGFNVLTGETGAGKSIILGALSLLLGSKASSDIVRSGHDKAKVEAIFEIAAQSPIWQRLRAMGIESDSEGLLILRREISHKGRSRNYINNTSVTVTTMAEALSGLVAIHGQHQHQMLLEPKNHLAMLDRFADLWTERLKLQKVHTAVTAKLQEIATLRKKERELVQKQDLIGFQMREIDQADLRPGEEEELRREEKILSSAHKYMELLQRSYALLYDDDNSICTQLSAVAHDLEEIQQIDGHFVSTTDSFTNSFYQLQEVADFIRSTRDRVEIDPQRLDIVVQRLDEIKKLKRKYGETVTEILAYRQKIQRDFEESYNFEQRISELMKSMTSSGEELRNIARSLSRLRKKAALGFKKEMESELKELGMQSVTFEVIFKKVTEETFPLSLPLAITPEGLEEVEFMISPNVGETLKPLVKIASGGEISRIMLAFRGLIADIDDIQTLVFDEIDVGIGGHIARTVGKKICSIAATRQVLCVTHLPQIASMSPHHLLVLKQIKQGRTYTKIKLLTKDERIAEIARMLDGDTTSELAKDHAAQLLIIENKR
ncbi:DNA repair protein RecN [candidate division CSSED10-310 bacterium]|uniref:DNA repair protein RecN n=1 Tax=candidate division CSSED10-310 bacterium TaxID=2855610 RepID=A0ABV6YY38_UNCC1